MFDSPEDAYRQLANAFSRPQAEIIVKALVPTLVFQPRADGALVLGGTRIGGTPDLPPGLTWPRRALPADVEAIARRANNEAAKEIREHFQQRLPYAFFAQIDLAEARSQGQPSGDLPETGRLLFFYDLAAGPWDTGTEAARVIWDQSPRESLQAQAMPADLAEVVKAQRAESAAINAKYDLPKPRPDAGTSYNGPSRPMMLRATLRPPAGYSVEMETSPALKAAYDRDPMGRNSFRQAYDDRLSRAFDKFYGEANPGRRNQLLGSPLPEQDDPRYAAEVVTRFGVQHLDEAQRKAHGDEVVAAEKNWRLLLQIDVGDFMREDGQGTVYFLIRATDLAERRFDRVVAVYQQT
ncbi:DUF1963 domain-containing protein [Methylobacterium sp. C25]|uniref:DUF1963 domain-containing protein n=1 Tax=Methylobacterium sp. C25 TaxID=2721622 RepID=UPI001F43E65A|nr:YwqG family protein [Methylobacterium sp. C25]MCE4223245.1 DUF1963 domain-containing protein [Methylobacterium sp. C25]